MAFTTASRLPYLLAALVFFSSAAHAQQPFVVDDAEVTPSGVWHVEISSQADVLRRSARPAIWQNTFEVEVAAGLPSRIEVGVLMPALGLVLDADPGRVTIGGPGDISLSGKLRLTDDPSARQAWSVALTIEVPSGNQDRQLGSGLVDYGMNLVSQTHIGSRWTMRLNGGFVLAGNTQSGALGFKERGPVVTGGASVVGRAHRRLFLGSELFTAWSEKARLGGTSVGLQAGGNFVVLPHLTIDFAAGTGWFSSSPKASVQVGLSIDLNPVPAAN